MGANDRSVNDILQNLDGITIPKVIKVMGVDAPETFIAVSFALVKSRMEGAAVLQWGFLVGGNPQKTPTARAWDLEAWINRLLEASAFPEEKFETDVTILSVDTVCVILQVIIKRIVH